MPTSATPSSLARTSAAPAASPPHHSVPPNTAAPSSTPTWSPPSKPNAPSNLLTLLASFNRVGIWVPHPQQLEGAGLNSPSSTPKRQPPCSPDRFPDPGM